MAQQKGKPFVTLELDKPRRLRFGINALCELEDLLGVSVDELDTIKDGVKELRIIIFCGLKGGDKDLAKGLTLEDVGDMIDEYVDNGGSMTELGEKLQEALGVMFPEANQAQQSTDGKN